MADFGGVAAELKNVGRVLESLKTACQEVRGAVKHAKGEIDPVLDEAAGLESARRKGEMRRRLLEGLRNRVCVTQEERSTLTGAEDIFAEHDGKHFFETLGKVRRVHQRDCEVLLTAENQRLALDVMNDTASLLEKAYQKVYRWTTRELQIMNPGRIRDESNDNDNIASMRDKDSRNLNLEDPQLNSRLRRALHALADRPGLFSSVLNGFSEARRGVLADSFRRAVSLSENIGKTRGRAGSSAGVSTAPTTDERPIGFVAHDPLRYVGDMLAWCHAAMVSEREAVESLFLNVDDNDPFESHYGGLVQDEIEEGRTDDQKQTRSFDWSQTLRDLVALDLDGVTHVLHSRIEVIIQGLIDPVTAHKMRHLLLFYRSTFSRLIGGDINVSDAQFQVIPDEEKSNNAPRLGTSLVSTLCKLTEQASDKVKHLLHESVALIDSGNVLSVATPDANPPDYLIEALETLGALARAEADSLVPDTDAANFGGEFENVIVMGLGPYFHLVEKNSEVIANAEQRIIFKLNCLMAIQDTIAVSQILSSRTPANIQSRIRDDVHTLRKDLIETLASFFRAGSGLGELLDAFSTHLPSITTTRFADIEDSLASTLSTLPVLQPSKLLPLAQRLDAFLPSALVDALEQLQKLSSASLAKEITETAADVFVDEFERVEDVLLKVNEFQERQGLEEAENGGKKEKGAGEERPEEAGAGLALDKSLRMMYPRTSHEVRVLLS